MAARIVDVDDVIRLPTTSVLGGTAIVQACLRSIPKVAVVSLRAQTFQASRRSRPTWAVVLAIVLSPLAGLGLLLLLVRRTDRCQFEIVGDRGDVSVCMNGRMRSTDLDLFLNAIGGRQSLGQVPARRTVGIPRPGPAGAAAWEPVAPARSTQGAPRLQIGDESPLPAGALGVVGRDPRPMGGLSECMLVTVKDETCSVSKTHFAFGPSADALWIEDLGSTNGTFVTSVTGESVRLEPHRRTPVPRGAVVTFGDHVARVASE